MKIVALIPAYNEAENIVATLQSLSVVANLDQIVVVNDGSTDVTKDLVCQLASENPQLCLVDLETNSGKGAALNRGLELYQADVYLFLDGDLTTSANLAEGLLEPVIMGQADLSIAQFAQEQCLNSKGMGLGLARSVASFGVYKLTGTRITNPLSGQRACTAELLAKLGPIFQGFGVEIGLTVGALHHGFRVVEIPLAMHHRGYGRGIRGFKHRGKQFIHIIKAFWECKKRGWY